MPLQQTVLLTGILLVLLTEYALWHLFRRRVKGFLFPHETDISHFRFFTLARLRLCAIAHTVFLLVVVILSLWLLW